MITSTQTLSHQHDSYGLFTKQDVVGAALATVMALGPLSVYAIFG